MSYLSDIHGQFFYEMLRHEDIAKDFFLHYLPDYILKEARLETLRLSEATTFKSYDLEVEEEFYALNFEVDLKDVDFFFCILVLHRFHVDEDVALRFFGRTNKIWKHYRDSRRAEFKEGAYSRNLPIIIPFVFYHGLEEWDVGLYLSDLFPSTPEELIKDVMDPLKYSLFNLSKTSSEAIKGGPYTRMFLDVARHIFDKDFSPVLERAMESIAKQKKGQLRDDLFLAIVEYIVRIRNDISLDTIRDLLYTKAPKKAASLLANIYRLAP